MKGFLFRYRYQILLVFIGIVWISLLNEILQIKNQNVIYSDSDNYRESADFLYHNFKAHYYRPLGMAAITGLPYLFGGDDTSVYNFSLVINVIAWLASALLLFSFLKKSLSDKMAFAFSLIFYSALGPLFTNFHLLTESLFTFIMLLSFYFIDRYYSRRSFYFLSLSISILLFAILIKPGAKLFCILIMLYFSRKLLKNVLNRSAILIYVTMSLIIFQCLMVRQEYGDFTLSYIDGVTYYNYLGNRAKLLNTNEEFVQANARARYMLSLPFPLQKETAVNDAVEQLKNNKINLIKAYLLNLADNTKSPSDCINVCKNLNGTSYFETAKNLMSIISKYQNRFFTVLGSFLALYCCFRTRRRPDIYTLMSLFILCNIAVSGISCQQGDRFHIVFFPFAILLIGKTYADKTKKHIPE
ncbi:hypothetical protein AAEO56_09975 [Flavobacterium sp. DGU11]|uniref:Dolichyl-phosphate-mannose-protein mannosyltransferase n=1 Tax=Flavobacterium arundinis TaxID=3139143 RepID=A0ABU9HWP2_9FLAO